MKRCLACEPEDLGQTLYALRRSAGLTQQQVAAALEMHQQGVARAESETHQLNVKSVQRLAAACGYRTLLLFVEDV